MNESKCRSFLLGIGLDNRDGHVRITKGTEFRLYGGSQETHERMQETVIKINEKLTTRGKRLDEVSEREFTELAREVGLVPAPAGKGKARRRPDVPGKDK